MGHKGRGGSAATPRSRWPGGGGSGGGGGGGGGSSGDGFASRKDAFMTSKVMDVIADFQAALDQLPPDPRRPLASAQRRWDPDAILQHCKQQARHADLRRQQHRALLRWIADAVAIMKQMERDELDGANDDVPDLVRLSGDGAGAHHDDGEASTRIGTSVDEDEDDEDDDEQSSEDLDALEDVPMMVVKDSNIMNQSLLSMYESRRPPAAPAAAPASSAPQQSPAPAAKDTASQNNHAVTPADNGAPELAARETRVAEAEERIRKMREANGTSKRRRNRAADQPAKRSKTDAIADKYAPPDKRLSDLGGIDHCIEEVLQLIAAAWDSPPRAAWLWKDNDGARNCWGKNISVFLS
ncbi:hypothetical protein HK405_008865 [Cladochytrium tenue]|nr:hypothetical protein HK405_008865 [Cladochytrium tenue]